MLRRGPLSLRARTHWTRRLGTSSSSPKTAAAEKEEEGNSSGLFASWVGKIKGAFQSKDPSPQTSLPAVSNPLLACADELKKITRVANLASLAKLRRDVTQQAYIEHLEKCSTIYRALGKHNPTGENVDAKQKALAAAECGCTIQEVDRALASFAWLKRLEAKMKQMHEKGEEIPKTMEEMEKLVKGMFNEDKLPQSQTSEVGRNAPCSCGSGKKFKRCCGRGT